MEIRQASARRFLAGLVFAMALLWAPYHPAQVAASSSTASENAGMLAALQTVVLQAYEGSSQFAKDLRSLYTVYQLQSVPAGISASEPPAMVSTSKDGRLLLCERFAQGSGQKKKSTI